MVGSSVKSGDTLETPVRRRPFVVGDLTPEALVLVFGQGHRTPIPWWGIEGIAGFLSGRSWVAIGGKFAPPDDPESLDGYLKEVILLR